MATTQERIEALIKQMEASGSDSRSIAPLRRQLAGIKKVPEPRNQEVFAGAHSRRGPEKPPKPSDSGKKKP